MQFLKIWYLCLVCLLFIPINSNADLVYEIGWTHGSWDATIRTTDTFDDLTPDGAGNLAPNGFELTVGTRFNSLPPIPYEGVNLALTDGAKARMEFEDFVDYISVNGFIVESPNPSFRISAGLRPTDRSFTTTSIFSMNHTITTVAPQVIDVNLFDGSQVIDGYLIDYIEWTITNPNLVRVGDLNQGTYGNWYTYQLTFDTLNAEIYGDPVPVPSSLLLLVSGLTGIVLYRRKRK